MSLRRDLILAALSATVAVAGLVALGSTGASRAGAVNAPVAWQFDQVDAAASSAVAVWEDSVEGGNRSGGAAAGDADIRDDGQGDASRSAGGVRGSSGPRSTSRPRAAGGSRSGGSGAAGSAVDDGSMGSASLAAPTSVPAGDGSQPTPAGSAHPGTWTIGPYGSKLLTGTRTIALTFDDGPDPTYTPQILDLLKTYRVKATFCVIGSRARDYPDLVRRIVAEGHSLCNHSWQHLTTLGDRDASYQDWDLRSTNDAIHAAVPGAEIKYFRAPGGNFTRPMIKLASSLGMTSLSWDVDPRDWDAATYGTGPSMVDHVVATVEQTIRPGSIVLSHDRARPDTVAAYQVLLPWILARFVTTPLP